MSVSGKGALCKESDSFLAYHYMIYAAQHPKFRFTPKTVIRGTYDDVYLFVHHSIQPEDYDRNYSS
jgi:hypothetical protein